MNSLLDITGHFLYLALTIILLPVFIALDIFLGAWLTLKLIRKWGQAAHLRIKRKPLLQPAAFKKSFGLLRTKSISMPANGH